MMAKPMKTLELHYPRIQFLITNDIPYPRNSMYMGKNLDTAKPRYSEHILPVPWPFNISSFHCIKMFFTAFVLCSMRLYSNSKHAEGETI